MSLKIPPVIVTLISGGLMWTVDRYLQIVLLNFDIAPWVVVVFCGTGGIFGLLGLVQFYRHSTSIDPYKPDKASDLVTDGIYGVSRNPMYLGLLSILAGYAFYLGNLLTFLLLPLFMVYMNRYQILPEEVVMEEKFGDEYLRYTSEVRRWL